MWKKKCHHFIGINIKMSRSIFTKYMIKKFLIFLGISIFCLTGGYFTAKYFLSSPPKTILGKSFTEPQNSAAAANVVQSPASNVGNSNSLNVEFQSPNSVQLDVPFVVQAPFGNWNDPIFQNACEESSIVMAMGWLNNIKTIAPSDAQNQIQNIVDFENKTFGYNADTDVFDVAKIFSGIGAGDSPNLVESMITL